MNTADDALFTREVLVLMDEFCRGYMFVFEQKPCGRKKKLIRLSQKDNFFLSSFVSGQIHHKITHKTN